MPAVMAFSQIVFEAHQLLEFIAHTLDADAAGSAGSRRIFGSGRTFEKGLFGPLRIIELWDLSTGIRLM